MKIVKIALIGLIGLFFSQLYAKDTDSFRKEQLKTEILKNLNDKSQDWVFSYQDKKKGWEYISLFVFGNNLEAINFDNYDLIIKAKKRKNLIYIKLNQDMTVRPFVNIYGDKRDFPALYIGDSLVIWTVKDKEEKYAKAKEICQLFSFLNNIRLSDVADKELAEFQKIVANYKALSEKPTITEEQRKYIVQANSKNEKKEYKEALNLYQKVIDANPISYPSAYNNMALIAAQIENYVDAIYSMKKYLLLMPDAPDTRAAQDKIYEWEAEIGK